MTRRKQLKHYHRRENYCLICGLLIPKDYQTNAPNAPSLDHIIPRAKQEKGQGRKFNKQLTHRYCNGRKGNIPIERLQDKLTREAYRRGLDSAIRQWETKHENK